MLIWKMFNSNIQYSTVQCKYVNNYNVLLYKWARSNIKLWTVACRELTIHVNSVQTPTTDILSQEVIAEEVPLQVYYTCTRTSYFTHNIA